MGQVVAKNTNMNKEYYIPFTIFPLYFDSWAFACVQLAWQFVTKQGQGSCTRAKTKLSQYKGKIVSRKLCSLFIFVFFDTT